MSGPRKQILFLYTEIASYFLAAARTLAEKHEVDIHIVRWPIHPDAPFQEPIGDWAQVYERRNFDDASLLELCRAIQPSLIYSSGWVDRGYRAVAAHFRHSGVPVVCGLDTQWVGSWRQRAFVLGARVPVRRWFTHVWVAGLYQYEFARRLGFSREEIVQGVYTADVPHFAEAYRRKQAAKDPPYPRRLLFVGRLVADKGIQELHTAFSSMAADELSGWTLHVVGTGPLRDLVTQSARIEVTGFVQPEHLPHIAANAGAFVLPSRREPWGVALHEHAAAGLPLLASDACGAATAFLRDGYNGYSFRAGNEPALRDALRRLFRQSDQGLRRMGDRSHELALQITPESWASTLFHLARA